MLQCVILAGGLATRMRPLTETVPKALIEIEGRPFLDYQLQWLSRSGVTDVVLSIGYKGEMIRGFAGDGSRWKLKIRYVDEGQNLRGTAGALRLALDEGVLAESFLVTYGDSFLPIDFADVFASFQRQKKPALMTVLKNEGRWDTSNVIFQEGENDDENDQRIIAYDKKRQLIDPSRYNAIDYGLTALERSAILNFVEPDKPMDLASVFSPLSVSGQLAAYQVTERFYEIGSPQGLDDFKKWVTHNATLVFPN